MWKSLSVHDMRVSCVQMYNLSWRGLTGTQGSRSSLAFPFPEATVKPREPSPEVLGRPREQGAGRLS